MEDWKEYKLGDVVRLINGRAYLQHELFDDGKYRIVRVGNLSGGDRWFYSNLELSEEKYCEKGDLLYAWACNFGPYIWKDEKTIYHYHIWKLVEDKTVVDKLFLFHYLKYLTPYWLGNVNGSVMVHITKGTMEKFLISLPTLITQRRIAAILQSFDDKIEVNRRINENLEQQAQTLFKSWFVDFEPFRDGEFVDSELGRIPKGWRVQEAQDVFDINIGKTPPRKESEWFTVSNEDNVWVSIADMGSCGVFISDSSEYLTNNAIKRFNIQMIEKDTVLLSFKLTVGRVAIADTRLTTNEAIARFILPYKCYREFLYLYLKQYKYENLGSTSSIATAVNSKTIKGMKLLFSPIDIVESFSKNTKPLFEQIRTLQRESRRLAELRDALLPKLMSGELKVKDVTI